MIESKRKFGEKNPEKMTKIPHCKTIVTQSKFPIFSTTSFSSKSTTIFTLCPLLHHTTMATVTSNTSPLQQPQRAYLSTSPFRNPRFSFRPPTPLLARHCFCRPSRAREKRAKIHCSNCCPLHDDGGSTTVL